MRRLLLYFFILINSIIVGYSQEELDLHQAVAEQDGYTLTMDDILVVLMSNQQMGQISLNPTEHEIQSVALITTEQFQKNPTLCMQSIQTLRDQFDYYGPAEEPIESKEPKGKHNLKEVNPGAINLNQKNVEKQMAVFISTYYPQSILDFNSSQAIQLKSTLAGALLYNQDSHTYISGSFGSTKVTLTETHLCPDGSMTEVISSRMGGGSEFGSFDSGDDQPLIERGFWSIAILNDQLVLMITVDGATGGFPIVNEGQTIIMDNKRWKIGVRQATCY